MFVLEEEESLSTEVIGDVALKMEGNRASNSMCGRSIRRIEAALDQKTATVHKILRKIFQYYPYKRSHV